MTRYIDDEFMLAFENDGVLMLEWKDSTKSLCDDKFKVEAVKFEKIIRQLESKCIIVDMRDFQYNLCQELLDWRVENIITAYNEIGVKKFAFISDKEMVNQDDPKNTFVTKYFKTVEESMEWLDCE